MPVQLAWSAAREVSRFLLSLVRPFRACQRREVGQWLLDDRIEWLRVPDNMHFLLALLLSFLPLLAGDRLIRRAAVAWLNGRAT